jgi:hypothetical protein
MGKWVVSSRSEVFEINDVCYVQPRGEWLILAGESGDAIAAFPACQTEGAYLDTDEED